MKKDNNLSVSDAGKTAAGTQTKKQQEQAKYDAYYSFSQSKTLKNP